MQRPICFDLTHLIDRIDIPWPSGIDKVDMAYADHFTETARGPFVRYGTSAPRIIQHPLAREYAMRSRRARWQDGSIADDTTFSRVRGELTGQPAPLLTPRQAHPIENRTAQSWLQRRWREITALLRKGTEPRGEVPEGAIYLNVAQHRFEAHEHFTWLDQRPDVVPAFLIHDLLPLDYPEFFHARDAVIFERRMQTAFKHGKAFILTSEAVRDRVSNELDKRGLKQVPMTVAPLPSSLGEYQKDVLADPALANVPYFVTIGTIEPRKNHLLLLSVWRAMAEAALPDEPPLPKLVIVGGRGWENEQVLDVLERGRLTRSHVVEAAGLSSVGLATLVANARAVLMPSFAEGYGLPLVEALTIGTPVVTTDAPVFREVTQNCALYRDAIDGLGWAHAIRSLGDPASDESRAARAAAQNFRTPRWPQYFGSVTAFLETLR